MMGTNFIETVDISGGGTIAVATLPADVSRRHLYQKEMTNTGGAAAQFKIKQARHADSFTNKAVVKADGHIQKGGEPDRDRLLSFDAGATIEAAVPEPHGTISATLGFVDE